MSIGSEISRARSRFLASCSSFLSRSFCCFRRTFSFLGRGLGQVFFLLAFKHDFMLFGAVALYGFFGNITPIARAALADTELRDNFRFSVGLSTIAIALGWVLMPFASYYMQPFIGCILVTALCFASSSPSFWV